MKDSLVIDRPAPAQRPRAEARAPEASFWEGAARGILFKKLASLARGRLEIFDAASGASRVFGPADGADFASAKMTILRPDFYVRALLGGSTGVGETYAEGGWEADDLTALVRIFVANRDSLNALDSGWGAFFRPLERAVHFLRRNTVRGSRDNIRAHYDLGNDFFGLFLDESRMYSCAIFPKEDSTLLEASTEKNDRICRKLRLSPSDHVLEIGAGWGGFAIHAAKNYGCRVTTTTISRAQHDYARERIDAEGLQGKITLLMEDYRKLTGTYDKLVSIEMIEAVGLDRLDTYFEACSNLLKPDGAMVLQSILIRDHYYDAARKSVDFIQRHIFPGSGIPSVSAISESLKRKTDFHLSHKEDITPHYARTLRAWSERLQDRKGDMAVLGYPEHLYRLWQFYFSYCEGGFIERSIGVAQFYLAKPAHREPVLLGDI